MVADAFRIGVEPAQLEDLARRLAATRWPDALDTPAWTGGTDLAYLQELVRYWRESFDWPAQQARLNELAQFTVTVDGLRLHLVHQRGNGPSPMPLVLTHGWPSTFFELHKVVAPLADPGAHGGDPADAFDVVVPSLPGYGFSAAARSPGMSPRRIAGLWARLMSELGYGRFGAHGGDWGAYVTALLGLDHADRVAGIHMTMMTLAPAMRPEPTTPHEREQRALARRLREEETGYQAIQSTRPQTLGYGLADSPAGLAAWILEKWRAWSDCGGDLESRFTKDELLTTVSIYWFTNTITSSMRLYAEARADPVVLGEGERVGAPAGFAMFRADPGRERAARVYDVRRYTVLPKGGHFAAMEEPDALVEEIREFFRPLR